MMLRIYLNIYDYNTFTIKVKGYDFALILTLANYFLLVLLVKWGLACQLVILYMYELLTKLYLLLYFLTLHHSLSSLNNQIQLQ